MAYYSKGIKGLIQLISPGVGTFRMAICLADSRSIRWKPVQQFNFRKQARQQSSSHLGSEEKLKSRQQRTENRKQATESS